MSGEVAVDLGTARMQVADGSGRVLLDEPTVAAVNTRDGSLVSFGSRAAALAGRTAGEIELVRPIVRGQPQDLALTDQLVKALFESVAPRVGKRLRVMCTVPGLATGVQRRALERAFKAAGAREVEFIEHAVAVGIGLRLHLDEPVATMVVDLGAGTTDVAVMALGGVVTEACVPAGGDDLDRAVRDALVRSFDLVVSPAAAEAVKAEVVTAWPEGELKMEVAGRDVSNGMTRTVVVGSSELSAGTTETIRAMVEAVVSCIVNAPPDLANDLLSRGLYLAGGTSLLRGLGRRLAADAGIPVHVAEVPWRTAVLGASRCLRELAGP